MFLFGFFNPPGGLLPTVRVAAADMETNRWPASQAHVVAELQELPQEPQGWCHNLASVQGGAAAQLSSSSISSTEKCLLVPGVAGLCPPGS